MTLPKEKQIDIVISRKKNIVELTNRILKIVHEADKTMKFSNEQQLQVKQLVNETVSELSTIASFCGTEERNWVLRMTNVIAPVNVAVYWETHSILEYWCTMANSITLDFNKTPFKFFGADFKLKLRDYEARIKATADRRESSNES
jgi:hypothetical protein